jgi:CcmD family protein
MRTSALIALLTVIGICGAESDGAVFPLAVGSAALYAQAPQQQDEFVPIDELPPQDQLPAAPLLVAAYSFVALALFAYVVSVARRMAVVQRELERLESDLKRSGRT